MKLFNNKIRKNSAILFLSVFLGFLALSFFHSHSFDIKFGTKSAIWNKTNTDFDDLLLDASSNCKLHSFSNSIKFEETFQSSNAKFIGIETIKYKFHFYRTIPFISPKNLRAPPEYLV